MDPFIAIIAAAIVNGTATVTDSAVAVAATATVTVATVAAATAATAAAVIAVVATAAATAAAAGYDTLTMIHRPNVITHRTRRLCQLRICLCDVVQGGLPRWATERGLVEGGRPAVGCEGKGLQGDQHLAEHVPNASADGTTG